MSDSLKKDLKFRKLVAEYLHWIFTIGAERVFAHDDVCAYLIANWDIYQNIEIDESKRDIDNTLHLAMQEFITNDVVDSLKYPVDSEGRYIRNSKYTKQLVDRFCDKLDQMKEILAADLDDDSGDPLLLNYRYQNLDKYLDERRERNQKPIKSISGSERTV